MKSLFSICILLTAFSLLTVMPLFAQTDDIDDPLLLDLLKQRADIKKEMEAANEAGDYDKYKSLEEQWNSLDVKIKAREDVIKTSKQRAKRLLDEASSSRRDKKYSQAQAKYQELLTLKEFIGEDKIPGIKLMIAFCMERQKKYPDAERTYAEVIEMEPDNDKAYAGKARALSKMGKDSDAVSVFRKAIDLNPTDYQNYFFLAQSYEKIGMKDNAEINYNKAAELNPEYYQAWYNLGVLQYKMKKYNEAVTALKSAVQSDPKYRKQFHKAFTLMAQSYNVIGEYASAIDAAESAINLKNNYGPAHLEKGIALQKSERYNQAIKAFENCLNDRNCRDSAQWHINLIKEKYLQSGE